MMSFQSVERLSSRSNKVSDDAVDLRLLDYASPVDSNLICPICHCPLIRPRRLDCDHIFCHECLSTAQNSQQHTSSTCPTCRRRVDERPTLPIPRILLHILDELVVKCPNATKGCEAAVRRGEIQDHISLYCDYAEVKCSLETCFSKVRRKDSHRGCLHASTVCEFCQEPMLVQDLEEHVENVCRKREASCAHCSTALLYRELDTHESNCPEAISSCPALSVGCKFRCKRTDLVNHTLSCPLVALQPFLTSHKARLEQQEAIIKLLQRKTDLLEGGLASVQAMLGNTALGSETPTLGHSSSLTLASFGDTDALQEHTAVDPSTQHLLSLHESLREEVNRVSVAVSELDARSNMMIMNESLRRKEENAHTNAALNSMRVQLVHWFYNARMQTQARYTSGASSGTSSTFQTTGVSGKGALPVEPVRRSSDSARQETKL